MDLNLITLKNWRARNDEILSIYETSAVFYITSGVRE